MPSAALEAPRLAAGPELILPLPPELAPPAFQSDPFDLAALEAEAALAANAAIPLAGSGNPAARPLALRARTLADRARAELCLAQAVYYEARSEQEEGQRAVAQVVLNRLAHPSWPNSVCGVVYQGPMRPGGGCQFTFTCDGSLASPPQGVEWLRARRIAAEALAGKVFAPVGLATHYHADYVLPHWAPKLHKAAVLGTHIFYRTPGRWGAPAAFAERHAGAEPVPRPVLIPAVARASLRPPPAPAPAPQVAPPPPAAAFAPHEIAPDPRWKADNLPESTIREAWRHSGRWRADAPASAAQ